MKNKSVKLLLYCTKGKPYLYNTHFTLIEDNSKFLFQVDKYKRYYLDNRERPILNGKVVAEAECDLVEKYDEEKLFEDLNEIRTSYYVAEYSCVDLDELLSYKGNKDFIYGINLKNVKSFDKPKELSEYHTDNFQEFIFEDTRVRKAPQNMMYCYDKKGNLCVLISIQPQWLCKILNGEKTIECRKRILKVLKEMIK